MSLKIIGAGLAGLLAANMLRHRNPLVIEKQSSLPNNHSAVLRFRSRVISDVTGIEFKKVSVIKSTLFWRNHVANALTYAEKCTGTMLSDRSIPNAVDRVERYIAPPDLIGRLANGINIHYDVKDGLAALHQTEYSTISTIPMPQLMGILGFKHTPQFKSISGLNVRATVAKCDAYISLYVPNPLFRYSRISLMGNELIVEVPFGDDGLTDVEEMIYGAATHLGIEPHRLTNIEANPQQYSKIVPIDEDLRKGFMHWATTNHNIYSLGRYAVWRPSLLLDDLVQDVRKIEGWINKSNKYDMARDR